MYQYKMVQVSANVVVQTTEHKGNEAAAYLEGVVNSHAREGWEFYRVDPIGVNVKPGCLGGLFGQQDVVATYYVVTFRKA